MTLRARKRQATEDALVAAAMARFTTHGFDETSVDVIAEDAGVSRRTFFRYFPTKEAVFFHRQRQRLAAFADALEHDANDPWEAVRGVLRRFAKAYEAERKQLLAERRVLAGSRTLMAVELQVDQEWEGQMARTLAASRPAIEADVLAGAVVGAVRAVLRHWYEADGRLDLEAAGDRALEILEHGVLAPA